MMNFAKGLAGIIATTTGLLAIDTYKNYELKPEIRKKEYTRNLLTTLGLTAVACYYTFKRD